MSEEQHTDLHNIPQKKKDLLRRVLLFTTLLFCSAGLLSSIYPQEISLYTGLEPHIIAILAPVLLIVALGDLVLALFVFHSRDRV